MPDSTSQMEPFRLALLLYPECMPAGLFSVADMVRAANLRARRMVCDVIWAGVDTTPVTTWQGPSIAPKTCLHEVRADAVVVPGLWLSSASDLRAPLQKLAPVIRALRELPKETQVWSYCAGVLPVAASGRLHGQRATATWWLRESLQTSFPHVEWSFDEPMIISEGLLTAAGAHGYLPLVQHMLTKRLDPTELRDLQNLLMLPRPAALHATFANLELITLTDESLRHAQVIVQRSPAGELRLPTLAAQLHISSRTLARRVHEHTGLAAAQWMRRIKLRQVAEALCETQQPLKRIVDDLGFASEASLIRAFRQATGMTPVAYRTAHA